MNFLGISAIIASSQMMSPVRMMRKAKVTAATVLFALDATRFEANEVPGLQPSSRHKANRY